MKTPQTTVTTVASGKLFPVSFDRSATGSQPEPKAAKCRAGFKTIAGTSGLLCTLLAACLVLSACWRTAGTKDGLSTPLAAAKSFFTAMQAGDANAVQSLCLGSSEQKEWTVLAMRMTLAAAKLDDAATAKFGREETVKAFSEDIRRTGSGITDALAALANCDVKVDGTNAIITAKPGQSGPKADLLDPALKLQQAAGQWKVLLDLDVSKQDFNAKGLDAMGSSMDQCAADIRAGKLPTAAAAQRAMMAAAMTKMTTINPDQTRPVVNPEDKRPKK
jgi:hypothetical protein